MHTINLTKSNVFSWEKVRNNWNERALSCFDKYHLLKEITSNIILNGERLNDFPLRLWRRQWSLIILTHTTASNSHFNSIGAVNKKHTYRKIKDKTVTTWWWYHRKNAKGENLKEKISRRKISRRKSWRCRRKKGNPRKLACDFSSEIIEPESSGLTYSV